MIEDNLRRVRARIDAACQQAGRGSGCVALLAVSKTCPAEALRQAFVAGQRAFGENYVQEALEKITALADLPLEWHCIGPVQSNKTRLVAEHFQWVHTVDRLKIAQRLSAQRPVQLPPLNICIQINLDGGVTKSGVAPQEALALARQLVVLPGLRLRGLMCIPEPAPDFEAALALFIRARALFDTINQAGIGIALDTLSMGMSADLEAAVHGGSTLVRVGSAIFGARAA